MSSSPAAVKLRKSLQNPPESPWFDWIREGAKKYEGRLMKDDWASLNVGDLVTFVCPAGRELTVKVTGLPRFDSFAAAFDAFGSELIPITGIDRQGAIEMYAKYYKDEDVQKYGVVAIKVEPCEA